MLPTTKKKPAEQASSPLDLLFPLIRGLATLFIVFIGFMVFGMFGSLAFPLGGTGAFLGSACGIVISLSVACCVTGLWRSFLPEDNGAGLPHPLAVLVGGHGNFDLVLTIHEAEGIQAQGNTSWSSSSTFAEVKCGSNEVKSTSVSSDGVFNEQLRIKVAAADEGIVIKLKEQQLVGSAVLGSVYVDIMADIINADFPIRQEFPLQVGEGSRLSSKKNKASLVLSFDYTEDYPLGLADPGRSQAMETMASSKSYGAIGASSHAQFAKDERRQAHACC